MLRHSRTSFSSVLSHHLLLPLRRRRNHHGHTIFALSSGQGKSGVAVIRVSGPAASDTLLALTPSRPLPQPRKATLRTLFHPGTREILDRALTLWFPGPASFTGEDCAELHVHGGVAVVGAVLGALGTLGSHVRMAEPGEFTKRAFREGKLDLTQAEGLADLISAETEMQRRQAVRAVVDGRLKELHTRWRTTLLGLMAKLEAFIDFSESDELGEDDILSSVSEGVKELLGELEGHLSDARAGERLRHGVNVAIVGEPNVGKSSLLNYLAQRSAAIVSPHAGTTRDSIEVRLDLGGFPAIVTDTAGMRREEEMDGVHPVEVEGMARARTNAEGADLVLFVLDATAQLGSIGRNSVQRCVEERFSDLKVTKKMVLVNKSDLLETFPKKATGDNCSVLFVSCRTGSGMPEMLERLRSEVQGLCSTSLGESPILTRTRHALHLRRTCQSLREFLEDPVRDLGISCQHLRAAIREIGCMSGKVSPEQVLDVIFADFCIGK